MQLLSPLNLYFLLIVLVALQRMRELFLSKKNEKALLQKGAMEIGDKHFLWMKLLHIFWLLSCVGEAFYRQVPSLRPPWSFLFLALFLLGQALRMVAMKTLQERWTVKIFILPGLQPVASGIYRYLRHPNYLGVIIEILTLPLIYGLWWTALIFSLLNAGVLYLRIQKEEEALMTIGGYQEAFTSIGRFFPLKTLGKLYAKIKASSN